MKALLRDQSGQTLPIILMVLLLGVSFVVPAVTYAEAALITQRIGKDALVEEYSVASGTTYVMWRLLDSTYAANPPATETVTINGLTVTVNTSKVATATVIDQTQDVSINKTFAVGHELWLVASNADSSGNGVYLAYDTVSYPASIQVPWTTAGTLTYYLHNNPTPPLTDTTIPNYATPILTNTGSLVDNLTANLVFPVTTTLHNYDLGHDNLGGRWLPSSDNAANCEDKVMDPATERIVWRVTPGTLPDTINGTVKIRWWWGRQDGTFGSHTMTWYLCDYDPSKPVRRTGGASQRNPVNITSGGGNIGVPSTDVWINPFDVRSSASGRALQARVDRTNNSTVKVKSWQLQ